MLLPGGRLTGAAQCSQAGPPRSRALRGRRIARAGLTLATGLALAAASPSRAFDPGLERSAFGGPAAIELSWRHAPAGALAPPARASIGRALARFATPPQRRASAVLALAGDGGEAGTSLAQRALPWLPTLVLVGAVIAVNFGLDSPDEARWTAHNDFDDAISGAITGDTRSERELAADISDYMLIGIGGLVLTDAFLQRRDRPMVDRLRSDGNWLLASMLTTQLTKAAAARERPYVDDCALDPDYDSSCGKAGRGNESFYSGHVSIVSTLAGLLCERRPWREGRRWRDVAWCGSGIAAAITTGFMRIRSADHYATDVIAGWAVGALFGYVLPRWVERRFGPEAGQPANALVSTLRHLEPAAGPDFAGFRFGFRF